MLRAGSPSTPVPSATPMIDASSSFAHQTSVSDAQVGHINFRAAADLGAA
jgi:hypothetical protein